MCGAEAAPESGGGDGEQTWIFPSNSTVYDTEVAMCIQYIYIYICHFEFSFQ